MGNSGVLDITELLLVNSSLMEVNILNNSISLTDLEEALHSNAKRANIELTEVWDSYEVVAVANRLQANEISRNIVLSTFINDHWSGVIAKMIKANTILQSLSISFKDGTSSYNKEIAEALKINTTLQEIWLERENAKIGNQIPNMLKVNSSLTVVGFSGFIITDENMRMLCNALAANHSISKIAMNSCSINNNGAYEIASMLRINMTLRNLIRQHDWR